MNTWAVELVSKLVDESKTWEEFGANVAKALMRERERGALLAAVETARFWKAGQQCSRDELLPHLVAYAERIERGEV